MNKTVEFNLFEHHNILIEFISLKFWKSQKTKVILNITPTFYIN